MFTDSGGCKIVGTEFTSKHQRLALTLLPSDGASEFRVAFTNVAAYHIYTEHLGKIIETVRVVSPAEVVTEDWEWILRADIEGLWPGPPPQDAGSVSEYAIGLGLHGYSIELVTGVKSWALSHDYVLLGRRNNA